MCPKPGPREKWAVENVQKNNRSRCQRLQRQLLHHYQQENREKCAISVTCGGFGDGDIQEPYQRKLVSDLGYTQHNIRKEGIPQNTSLHITGIPCI